MRSFLRCAAVAVVAATLLACDTEQPAQGGSVSAVLTIGTAETTIRKANVWEIWEDITFPRDGIPDRPRRLTQPSGRILHRCDLLDPSDPTQTDASSVTSYPWAFAVEISILRSGTTRPEIVTSTLGQSQRFSGVTILPTADVPTPIPDSDNDPTGPGDQTYATEYYRNGSRMSSANGLYALRCEGLLLTPNIGSLENPGAIALNPGDTLIVQARKATEGSNPVLGGLFPIPALEGVLTVGGRSVALQGTAQSTAQDGDGISFSYTLN